MKVEKIKCSSELMRQRNTPNEDAFKVTLQGLTLNEVEKVSHFVTDVLMKNINYYSFFFFYYQILLQVYYLLNQLD